MTCMVAAQPCGGNEAINQSIKQSIKKEQYQRDASLCLSVDSSLTAAARLLLACLASLAAAALVLSPSAPAHALAPLLLAPGQISLLSLLSFASRTPPTLLSLFLLFVVVSLSLLLHLAFALVWIDYTSPLRDRHLACWSVCSRHLVDLLLVRISSCDSERPPRCLCSPWQARKAARARLRLVCNAALLPRYARGVAGSMRVQCLM